MKFLIATLSTTLLFNVACAQGKVVVNLSNVRNDKGVVRACLFNTPGSFDGEAGEPFQCMTIANRKELPSFSFNNLPAGTYALFVFHDENNNGKLDKKLFGIPKEGYGASKNKLPFASAPSFEDNRFSVRNNSTIQLHIRMRNL